MSIGNWDPQRQATPAANPVLQPDAALLRRFMQLSRDEKLDQLASALSSDEQQRYAGLMRLGTPRWQQLAAPLDDDDIHQLMRFFTCAERLPGWESGEHSPVIGLGKALKQRGSGIPKPLVLWIKANSDNRFLPHGPLL